ncbi:hypothetical protein D3C80_1171640 [compost metagenome]
MHGITALTHIGNGFTQRTLHGLKAGKNGRNFVLAIHRNRTRQIAFRDAVKMTADNRQRQYDHSARPEQRSPCQQCRQDHHRGKNHARHVIAGLTVPTGLCHKLINILLPGVKAFIKCRLGILYRCGQEIRQLIVLKPGRLMLQIAVPLRITLLHLCRQRFPFFADRFLLAKSFKLCFRLLQAVARGGHQRLNVIRRIAQRG